MIISGGENIFPDEIESVYSAYSGVDEVAVIGVSDKQWGQSPVAFIVSSKPLSTQKLVAYGRQRLAHYKVPKHFYQIDHLPTNAGGKVQRYKLRKRLNDR
jgi:O-succinylbenzoic acid--CoA ligase